MGINDAEIYFAKYAVGKFYRTHIDTFLTQNGRILSVIYYLNAYWAPENGGNLIIYTNLNNIEKAIKIAPLGWSNGLFQERKT